ncbi:MAG: DUF58 domain-containing protein [Alphaproteobacteria bacterium]
MADRAEAQALHRQTAKQVAAKLPPLLVAADRVAATVVQGVHGRRRVGQGEAFWQFRHYQQGDSAARIDWRQSAKSQDVFVRETEWEAAQSVWLWRDTSPSMRYRSSDRLRDKRDTADLLLLALAALLSRGGERFALLGSGLPPWSGRPAFDRLADQVLTAQDRAEGLPAGEPLPRYAQVVLFGDFLEPPERIGQAVQSIAARGLRGQIVQVLDPAEEELPFRGRIRFDGFEGEGETLVRRVEAIRDRYLGRLTAHRDAIRDIARRAGWGFHLHRTDRPPESALLALYMALSPVAKA